MNYDFSMADKDALMGNGVLARTILLDRMVKQFIDENPKGTVVNIACGLDTRFYRVDNGSVRWYNLDLRRRLRYAAVFCGRRAGYP